MTLFRSIRRRPSRLERLLADFNREVDEAGTAAVRPMREEMPPRPQLREPVQGADTIPRTWSPRGPLRPEHDPCGAGPIAAKEGM